MKYAVYDQITHKFVGVFDDISNLPETVLPPFIVSFEPLTRVLRNVVYRNIKTRNYYKVLELAFHTETEETMVVYRVVDVLYKEIDEKSLIYTRPISSFKEKFMEV